MTPQPTSHPDQHTQHTVISAIANWLAKYRDACGLNNEMAAYTPEQIADIAQDLGISSAELVTMARKGPHAADRLNKLLTALGVDAAKLTDRDAMVMRDLQRLCISCGHKHRCDVDLASGASAEHFRDYCPNAFTLDALLKEKQ